MMKRFLFIIFFVLLFSTLVSAVRINELEINPLGGSSEAEWVELFNDGDSTVDISGWMLYDGLSSETLRYTIPENTTLEKEAYFLISFSHAILNNGGEYVILYDRAGSERDKTEEFSERTSSENTWQYCEEGWVFLPATQEETNSCEDTPDESSTQEESQEDPIEEESETLVQENDEAIEEHTLVFEAPEEKRVNVSPLKPITLAPQTIKKGTSTNELSPVGIYLGLGGFALILGALLYLRTKRYQDNEFD